MRGSGLLVVLAVGAGFGGVARAGEYEDMLARLTSDQPPAVAAVIHRRMACNRWFRYGPYDMRLSASPHAPRELRRLQCHLVDEDERLLRYRYRHSSDIKRDLNEADRAVF